jgi:integrase
MGGNRIIFHALRPRISFKNCCRTTYATGMADSGVPPHVVERLLGHSSQSTTVRHYIATLDESKVQAAAAFGESLDRARRAAGAKS